MSRLLNRRDDASRNRNNNNSINNSNNNEDEEEEEEDEEGVDMNTPYEFEDFYNGNEFLREEDPAPRAPRYVWNRVTTEDYYSRSKLYTELQLTELAEVKHAVNWTFQQIAILLSAVTKISIFISVIIVCSLSMWMAVRSMMYWTPPPQPQIRQDPSFWNVQQTETWMNEHGGVVGNYSKLFAKEEVDGELLFRLTDEDLASMGVDKTINRKKILIEIEKLKGSSKPYDFWSYRLRNKEKAEFLVVAFSYTPRLTILYLYIYEYEETLKPFLGRDTTYWFWISWTISPHLMCSWYASTFWNVNPFLVIAFFQICLQNAKLEVSILAGRSQLVNLVVWLVSLVIPLVHLMLAFILPSAIMTFFFYFYLTFSLLGALPSKSVDTPKANQHWPAPLEIPESVLENHSPPKIFVCPITHDVMREPCIGNGTSFERSAIEEWVKIHKNDPITRQPLSEKHLVPNLALRTLIEEWVSTATEKEKAQ